MVCAHIHRLIVCGTIQDQDTKNGQYVIDTQYNGGEIQRNIIRREGKDLGTFIFGKRLTGDD